MRGKPLSETNPELAAQAVGWDPSTVSSGSEGKKTWQCSQGHRWEAQVSERSRGRGCPYCTNRIVLAGFNDLKTTKPNVAAEADGWDPSTVVAGSGKRMKWQCSKGHQWEAVVVDRTRGSRCPTCTGRRPTVGVSDLATTHPHIAAQTQGWDPSTVGPSSRKVMTWRCGQGHSFEAMVGLRTQNGGGCPICLNIQVAKGVNDLATTNPEIAFQADGWDPTTVTAGSQQRRKWKCAEGHTWTSVVSERRRGRGCPYCANHWVWAGFNDIATVDRKMAAEADGWDPATVVFGSAKRLRWRCTLGHTWSAAANDRAKGTGCPFCSNNKLLKGFNDLTTVNPELAEEADGWDASEVLANSAKNFRWRCDQGHTWTATAVNRNSARGGIGSGCPTCAKTGYDPNANGYLYFLVHENWGLLQIGITNKPNVRLSTHQASGWEAIDVRGPMPGDIARQWERDILRALKERGVHLGQDRIADRFSGFTEAWIQEDFPSKSLKELMQLVYDDEDKAQTL